MTIEACDALFSARGYSLQSSNYTDRFGTWRVYQKGKSKVAKVLANILI